MMMHDAFDTADGALREHIKGLRRPSWNEGQVKREALRIVLGDRLFNGLPEEVKRWVQ